MISMSIVKPGSECHLRVLGGTSIPVFIKQCCIDAHLSASYEVVWFNGQTLCKEWVPSHLLQWDKEQRLGIGFQQ